MEARTNGYVEDCAVNIPTFYGLVGAELGLVVSIGVMAARRAMYRQEIKHASMVLESSPTLSITNDNPVPLVLAQLEPDPVAVGDQPYDAVAIHVSPYAQQERLDAAAAAKWVVEARDAAIAIANVKGDVTADDVISACPVPQGVHTRHVASVFSDTSEWQKIGERSSTRSHRKIAVWARRQAVAA